MRTITKKVKRKYSIDQQETVTIDQRIIIFNNALEEQKEKYIKMLMRLALTNPDTLKEYKWTDQNNTTLLPNNTTNA